MFTGRDEDVTVAVGGDASGLNSALDGAMAKLGAFRGAVAAAGAALGALAAGALAASTKAAADFEQQMVEVEKVTNPEIADEMAGSIRRMAAEMPLAQEELAGIAAQAGRFGVEGVENMEAFTESVSKMAVATDLSTEEAGEAFARMTTLLDEPISEVENLGSVVNELSNTMATSSSEITNAATRSAGALSQLGVSSEDVLALNAAMNEVSASSRIAGTRLRRMAQELQAPGKVEDFAAALGMSVAEFERMREESPGELIEQLATSFAEGGEQADALRGVLSTTSRSALASLSENLDGLQEAQDGANEQMEAGTSLQKEFDAAADTFNAKLQITKNRLRNVALQIGQNLLPYATTLLEHVNSAIKRFSEWNEQTDGMLGVLSLLTIGILGASVAAAALATALGGVVTTAATIAAPLLAVAAVVGALALAWRNNWLGIQDVTMRIVDAVRSLIADWLARLRELWRIHGDGLVKEATLTFNALRAAIQPVIDWIEAYWNRWGDEIVAGMRYISTAIMTMAEGMLDGLLTAIRVGMALIRGDWEHAWDLIKGYAGRTLERMEELVEPVLETINRLIGRVEDAINSAQDLADVDLPSAGGVGAGVSRRVPGLDTGGYIESGGLARLHPGEEVIPAAEVDRDGGSGGTTVNIGEIHASGRREGREAGKALHRALKGQGL